MRLCAFYCHRVTSRRANSFRFYSTRVVFQLFLKKILRDIRSPFVITEKFLVYLHVISPDTRVLNAVNHLDTRITNRYKKNKNKKYLYIKKNIKCSQL